MPFVVVKYADGTDDVYETEGGETWALAEELDDDPAVKSYEVVEKLEEL